MPIDIHKNKYYFKHFYCLKPTNRCHLFLPVIDDKTCEERLWNMKLRGETNFYLCEINRDMVIDATYKGNKSRYINHSCCPNTEMQKWLTTFAMIIQLCSNIRHFIQRSVAKLGSVSNMCFSFVSPLKDN